MSEARSSSTRGCRERPAGKSPVRRSEAARRETHGSPALLHRAVPSLSLLSSSASSKGDRRVPTLSGKHEAQASEDKPGTHETWVLAVDWFGWQKSVERIAVERPGRVERHGADSVTWLAGTRGSPQMTRALGGRAGENGAEQRDVGHTWPRLVTRSACASVVAFESSGGRARWLGCHTGREHAVVGHDEGVSDRACVPS